MTFGLKPETINKIMDVFVRYDEIDEAVLYGSRAKGNPKTGSDIDLTLKGERLNLKILNTVECELDDLLLPYSIDLSIHHQIDNPDLLDHINRIGKCFYKKPQNDNTSMG